MDTLAFTMAVEASPVLGGLGLKLAVANYHRYGVLLGDKSIYAFELGAFGGDVLDCSPLVVVQGVWLAPEHRGKGWGREFRRARNAGLKAAGYTYQLATVHRNNDVQNHIMKMTGAIQLTRLGDVYLYGQPL